MRQRQRREGQHRSDIAAPRPHHAVQARQYDEREMLRPQLREQSMPEPDMPFVLESEAFL